MMNRLRAKSMSETLDAFLDSRLREIRTVAPCVVLEYDAASRRAVVQPAIRMMLTDGAEVARAPLIDVPVAFPAAGGVELVFELQPGDTGLLLACERDISQFKSALSVSSPGSADVLSERQSVMLPTAFGSPRGASYELGADGLGGSARTIVGGLLATLALPTAPTTANTASGRIGGWVRAASLPGGGNVNSFDASGVTSAYMNIGNYQPTARCFAYLFIAKVDGVEKARAVMPLGPTGIEDALDERGEDEIAQYGVLVLGRHNPTAGYSGQIVLPRYRARRNGSVRIAILASPDGWDSDGNVISYTELPANATVELREAVI